MLHAPVGFGSVGLDFIEAEVDERLVITVMVTGARTKF
jgi:hypothetical protein